MEAVSGALGDGGIKPQWFLTRRVVVPPGSCWRFQQWLLIPSNSIDNQLLYHLKGLAL